MLSFVKYLFHVYWDSYVIFVLDSIDMIDITSVDSQTLNQPCIPGTNPTWACYRTLFNCCWIWLTSISLRISASIFIRDIGLQVSFSHDGSGTRIILAFSVLVVLSVFYFKFTDSIFFTCFIGLFRFCINFFLIQFQ